MNVQALSNVDLSNAVSVAVAVDSRGDVIGDPALEITGLPQATREGVAFEDIVEKAVFNVLDGLPKQKRRDPDLMEGAIERSVRGAVSEAWGKKPMCHVHVLVV